MLTECEELLQFFWFADWKFVNSDFEQYSGEGVNPGLTSHQYICHTGTQFKHIQKTRER